MIDWLETIRWFGINFIVPIIVAAVTYLVIDMFGEYKKRQAYSRLGIAIIESLQEEVEQGILTMEKNIRAINDVNAKFPANELLPNESWNGMPTIPDDVLLRIIETAKDKKFEGLNPRDCRIHCKNYFNFINQNFRATLAQSISLASNNGDWRTPLRDLLVGKGKYLEATQKVYRMLEDAKQLLEFNAKVLRPK